MSMSHHSSPEQAAAEKLLLDQFLNKANPSFPAGRINSDDQGELAFAVAADKRRRTVIIRFAKPVDWIGLGVDETRGLAKLLNEKADQIEGVPI